MQRRKYNNVQHAKELQNAAGPCLHWIAALNHYLYVYIQQIFYLTFLWKIIIQWPHIMIENLYMIHRSQKWWKKDSPELVAPNFYLDIYTFTWMISHWIMFVETYIEHENNTFMRLPTRKIFYLGVCNNKVYSDSLDWSTQAVDTCRSNRFYIRNHWRQFDCKVLELL